MSGLNGSIADVKLTLNSFNVPNAFNLGILLQAPSGAGLDVMSNACHVSGSTTFRLTDSGTVNGHAATNVSPCFNTGDWLATTHHFSGYLADSFPAPGPGSSGYTRAEPDSNGNTTGSSTASDSSNGNGTFANVFNGLSGTNVNGVWRLYVTNQALSSSTTGTIGSWTLEITTTGSGSSTTTTLSNPAPNPSFTSGSQSLVTLAATVTTSSGVATDGSVTFHDNSTGADIGTAAVNSSGVASTTFTFTSEGAHVLVATYAGGSTFAASPASSPVTQQVIATTTSQTGAPAGTVGFCNPGGITLPTPGAQLGQGPGKPYPSDIVVSGVSGIVENVKVYLNGYTSTNPSPNAFMLAGPNGKTLEFLSWTGGSTLVSNLNLIFDDFAASQALPNTVSLASRSYKPTSAIVNGTSTYCQAADCNGVTVSEPAPIVFELAGPAGNPARTLLEQFAGSAANGTWKLFSMQRGNPDTASVNNWCINFTMANGTATSTTLSASPNPATTGDPVDLTANVLNTASPGTPLNEGSVTFSDNVTGMNLGMSSIINGQATLSNISNLSEGDHTITAAYGGTANFGYSSGSLNLRINNPTVFTMTGGSYQYCNSASAIQVPGNNQVSGPAYPYPSNISVTHLPGTIKTVQVDFANYSNLNPQGLQSLLVGPCQTEACAPAASDAIDFFSNPSSAVSTGTINLSFLDAAANTIPNSSSLDVITGGPYRPFSRVNTNTYASPAPAGPYQYAAPAGNATPPAFSFNGATAGVFQDRVGNGSWSLYLSQNVASANDASLGSWCVNFTVNPPVLGIAKSHSGSFQQGSTGNTYTVHVTNDGPGPASGATTVVDDLTSAPGLTITDMSGTGWACTVGTKTCTSTADISAGGSFPDITVTVSVAADASSTQINSTSVSGGGSVGVAATTDTTTIIPAPDLTIQKSHAGNFTQGQTGSYSIAVSNVAAVLGATYGTTTVTDTLPAGWTLASFSGTGWSCSGTTMVTCTSATAVAGGSSLPGLDLTVNVPANSAVSVTNSATVGTVGEINTANNQADDPTTVIQLPATVTANSGTDQSATVNVAFANPLSVTVRDGANNPVPGVTVDFAGPASGASIVSTHANTNASGVASAIATANSTAGGPYTVTASVTGASSAAFALTNLPGTTDVTGQVRVTSTGLLYSRVTATFNGTLTITNTSAQPISAPIQLVLADLTPGVTLANATGVTTGLPYITVPSGVTIEPGASASVQVRFNNPSHGFVSYTPMVVSGGL